MTSDYEMGAPFLFSNKEAYYGCGSPRRLPKIQLHWKMRPMRDRYFLYKSGNCFCSSRSLGRSLKTIYG